MIFWERAALRDRQQIFEFLYEFNPVVAEKTDSLIEEKVENLKSQPEMQVLGKGIKGRLPILPDVSMVVSYFVDGPNIRVLRVLHQKQKFPPSIP